MFGFKERHFSAWRRTKEIQKLERRLGNKGEMHYWE
jgi:hypothetical protein